MKISEEQLEDYIFETYTNHPDKLCEQGLQFDGEMGRQITFGNYGRCDLITIQLTKNYALVNIIELKKGIICLNAFLQALRYAKGFQRYYAIHHPEIATEISITLIGSEIDTSTEMVYMADILDKVTFYTYEFGWAGIQFEHKNNYQLTNEGMKL